MTCRAARTHAPLHISLAAAMLALAAVPAAACLPPPPGYVEPTEDQKLAWVGEKATDLMSGEVVRVRRRAPTLYRFRIRHVYRGARRAGALMDAEQGWGFDPPMCPGMLPLPPLPPRARGTIYFVGDRPELNFLTDAQVQKLIAGGWIRDAKSSRPDR